MNQKAAVVQQALAKPKLKQIFVSPADEIADKHPHAQLLFDTSGPPGFESMGHNSLFINVDCPVLPDNPLIPDIDWVIDRLEEFEKSGLDYCEFESPHLPGKYFLRRSALPHIIAVQGAWSSKVRPRIVSEGVELIDANTGLPLLKQ